MAGPLHGVRVVEMAGLGPGPFCGMLMADLGADVVCIERPGTPHAATDITARGKRQVQVDLQAPGGSDAALALIARADLLIEGFRPGVMERLGLGPTPCHKLNPKLVYGRMTGWGQTGPLAGAAGHDINYVALTGALHAIGRPGEAPPPPLNYVGDYGGGAMLLAVGLLAALHEARGSGRGQVVDAAMTDGAALLSSMFYGMKAAGAWSAQRGENLLDGGAHFYDTYACADGKYVAIGALEPKFFRRLCELCGLDDHFCAGQMDRSRWPLMKLRLADVFRTRTRAEWCALLEGSDACFAPVLDWDEAPVHPHNQARGTFVTLDGVVQPAPAPRFSGTPSAQPAAARTEPLAAVLDAWAATAPRHATAEA
ncbi:MAG: CoA transferase [Comamonadaceae bacterium]|nr:MAG: CoA transferase [Comamonadaceae bacterium]